tara:strand:+ start:338 stop:568 length:231 start_codon:yes stop_codon:yes gene_type:complete
LRGKMKLVFYWEGLEEEYEGETWKECCEECVSQEKNWNRKLTKIMMESQTGNMEDALQKVYAYYNLLIDASLGLEE